MIAKFSSLPHGAIFVYKGQTLQKVSFAHGRDTASVIKFVPSKAYVAFVAASKEVA